MKILHTSDWHLGRTFHQFNVVEQLRQVLDDIADIVRDEAVDTVVISGDIYDHSSPAEELFRLRDAALAKIRGYGAQIVMISGNHDSAARLGAGARWMSASGVHVLTETDAFRRPVSLSDAYGTVDFYAIPYLEPLFARDLFSSSGADSGVNPGAAKTPVHSHQDVLAAVMNEVGEQIDQRARDGHRSVVLAHCFATNLSPTSEEGQAEITELNASLRRDITSGGVDVVDASLFACADYAALGHIHSRQTLRHNVRYSGAPLHMSFGEAAKPRGVWIVELDGSGLAEVKWRDVVIPRRLTLLKGTLDELLTSEKYRSAENDWIDATLTDRVRPLDAMKRLKTRFPYAAHLSYTAAAHVDEARSYRERLKAKTPLEVIDAFLADVRSGKTATAPEKTWLKEALAAAGDPTRAPGEHTDSARGDSRVVNA